MSPDQINGAFEFGGALVLMLNVRRVWRDRRVSGVSWAPTAFFTAWGLWNLFYYPHLGQSWSFVGGLFVVLSNTIWLALAWRFGAFRKP